MILLLDSTVILLCPPFHQRYNDGHLNFSCETERINNDHSYKNNKLHPMYDICCHEY